MDQRQSVSESRVVSCESLAQDIFDLRLRTPVAKDVKPGQFAGIYPPDKTMLLPRPVSICDSDQQEVRLVFRIAGKGTASLSSLKSGDTVRVLGPLGNGYPLEMLSGKRVLLLGGGIGIPPLLYLARVLSGGPGKEGENASNVSVKPAASVTLVAGYRDSETFLADCFEPYATVLVASEDGSAGTRGTVLDVCRARGFDCDVICACGPKPMLAAVKEYAKECGTDAYLSLEERMACGIGACLACVTKTADTDSHSNVRNARVCTEGPVFPADRILF